MLMNDRPSVLSQLSKHLFSIYYVSVTGSRDKDTRTITSFEELMDLQGLTVSLFWKYPFGSFQKNRQERKENHLKDDFNNPGKRSRRILFSFTAFFLSVFPSGGMRVGREVVLGRVKGLGKTTSHGKRQWSFPC